MSQRVLLDTYCGGGGATKGYQKAGFYVVGVDNKPQPHYCGDDFILDDAIEFILRRGREFDWIHSSPPCQRYSESTPMTYRNNHPDLISATREMLVTTERPFVIENVEGARKYLHNPIMLCGSMFGLKIWRHRYFEINPQIILLTPACNHNFQPILITGQGHSRRANGKRYKSPIAEKRKAIQIDWMTTGEITQAIPWVYTEFIGKQLMQYLEAHQC